MTDKNTRHRSPEADPEPGQSRRAARQYQPQLSLRHASAFEAVAAAARYCGAGKKTPSLRAASTAIRAEVDASWRLAVPAASADRNGRAATAAVSILLSRRAAASSRSACHQRAGAGLSCARHSRIGAKPCVLAGSPRSGHDSGRPPTRSASAASRAGAGIGVSHAGCVRPARSLRSSAASSCRARSSPRTRSGSIWSIPRRARTSWSNACSASRSRPARRCRRSRSRAGSTSSIMRGS